MESKISGEPRRGGRRAGAGRKPEGKQRYNVTLTAAHVEKVKADQLNLSGLLDDLLARHLRKKP